MSSLPSGLYFISSSTNKYNFVGRHAIYSDDETSPAKKVLSLPLPPDVEPPQWVVEKLPSGRYKLKSLGAGTGIKGGLLWAYEPVAYGTASSTRSSSPSSSLSSDDDPYEDAMEPDNEEWEEEEWDVRPYKSPLQKNKPYGIPGGTYYTIEWATGGAGWVRQGSQPYTQVAIAPLSGQGKEEELWTVVHVPAIQGSSATANAEDHE